MTLTIPHGHKFACTCLKGVLYDYVHETQAGPFHLHESLSVHIRPARSLDSSWLGPLGALKREILGAIHYDQLINSNFVILATAPTKQYDKPNEEDEWLVKKTTHAFHAIRMHRAFSYDISVDGKGIILTGVNQDGELKLRSLSSLPVYCWWLEDTMHSIDEKAIMDAGAVADGLGLIETDGEAFSRLRRGVDSWIRGAKEAHPYERLHQFVRALDAILKLPKGPSGVYFIKRGKILSVYEDGKKTGRLLEEIYALRNATEHLNDWETALQNTPEPERKRHAFLRALQAERLACEAYARLLSNRKLLELFRDDSCIEKFWNLEEAEQQRHWGALIDLKRSTEGGHRSGV